MSYLHVYKHRYHIITKTDLTEWKHVFPMFPTFLAARLSARAMTVSDARAANVTSERIPRAFNCSQ